MTSQHASTTVSPNLPEASLATSVDAAVEDQLYRLLNSTTGAYAREVKSWLEDNWSWELSYRNEEIPAFRDKCHLMVKKLLNSGLISLEEMKHQPSRFFKLCEHSAWTDGSVAATLFAGYLIFGGSLVWLGTERHKKWYAPVDSYEMPGCFSMTEVAHGSNLRGLGTTATYDPETQEFIINTPTWQDAKWAIALLAYNARLTTVMAHLIMPNGDNKGIHSFLVPVRDADNNPIPGVKFADCDHLVGHNGVGIGGCSFDQVRIPRENLLNRFADVSPAGEHITEFKSSGDLFRAQVSPLMIERLIPFPSAGCKLALTIATRFSKERRQFGPRNQPETRIIEYGSHQKRLIPGLADTYAISLLMERIHLEADTLLPNPLPPKFRPLAAAFKSYAYEIATKVIREARECCSVQSFRHESKIARAMLDIHGFAHAAGDITVLYQYAARLLLESSTAEAPLEPFGSNPEDYDSTADVPDVLIQHRNLLQYRFQRLFNFVREQLMRHLGSGKNQLEAWNAIVTYAIDMANAYAQVMTHRHFLYIVRSCEDSKSKELLLKLAELHGWNRIAAHLGWFKDGEAPEMPKSAIEVDQEIMRLCRELARDQELLVRSFGIPEILLPPADLISELESKFA